MGAERSQWQFPANEVGKVIGWSDEASPSNPNASKGLVNKGPFVDPGDIANMVETTDTDASGFGFGIDEDDMASDSAAKFPYQKNVKAYADTKLPLVGATLATEMVINVDTHRFEVRKDSAPLNYDTTYAAMVLQERDSTAGAMSSVRPGAMFQFTSTGDGVVTSGSDASHSIWWGLTSSMTKTGDGSGHSFTALGGIGAYGAGTYNEHGLFVGSSTNTGSLHGTMSGVEVLLRDSPDAGVNDYDTLMNAVIGRVARYNNGSRISRNFFASSEGTVAPNMAFGLNPNGLAQWQRFIDLSDGAATTGEAILLPNNTSLAWMNAADNDSIPVMFLSGANELWFTSAAATGGITFANSALATAFRVLGVASSVNYWEVAGSTTGTGALMWLRGTDTDIGATIATKGAGVFSFYTNGASFSKQVEISHVASSVNFISLTGAVTTGHPIIKPGGSDSNPSIIVQGKGTGGVKVNDGGAATKFEVNTTGIGFFATAPVARGALAAPSGTITRTTFATGSVTLPQLAERVYAMINDLRAYGLFS